jgi:hypothetical protein
MTGEGIVSEETKRQTSVRFREAVIWYTPIKARRGLFLLPPLHPYHITFIGLDFFFDVDDDFAGDVGTRGPFDTTKARR